MLYDHPKDLPATSSSHPITRWSGRNRFSDSNSLLYRAIAYGNTSPIDYPDKLYTHRDRKATLDAKAAKLLSKFAYASTG